MILLRGSYYKGLSAVILEFSLTYHLIHRVIGIIAFRMSTANPDWLEQFLIFLFIFFRCILF